MICRKCGELLKDSARVCPICGARLTGSTGTTLNPVHRDSDDCAHAGEPVKRTSARKSKPFKSTRRAKKGKLGWILPLAVAVFPILAEMSGDFAWVLGLVVAIAIVAALVAFVRATWRAVRNVIQLHSYQKKERAYYDMQKMR